MKKAASSLTARVTLAMLFLLSGVVLLISAISSSRLSSATPASGSIGPAGAPLGWDGTATGTGSASGESTCVEGVNCDTFTLTVTGTQSDWANAGKRIEVKITPPATQDDYDLVIHKDNNSGKTIDSSGNGAGVPEVAHINPAVDGVGAFTIHVIYFATTPPDQYHGTATVVSLTPPAPPPAASDNGPKVGYENFEAPGILTPVTTTTGPTVEFMGRGAGEPSIGVNWNSASNTAIGGVTNFQSDLETLFISFSSLCSTGVNATWANRPAPTSQVIDSDPIGFTDRQTGRVFAAELTATSPTCKVSFSDNDGQTWVASSGPLGSGIDHETIGGGPYHAPIPPGLIYPNAVYYCSQDLVTAFCLRSDDGGAHFGNVVPTYTTECGGLHGHVKVSPKDGTVYLPNNNCGGEGAVVVSEDNGVSWDIRHVRNNSVDTVSGSSDPAVGIDSNGRVYFAIANADSSMVVATSDDHGSTWNNIVDVSSTLGLKNIRYPAAVAGDAGRAAVAFYGSTTAGSANAATFNGIWHLYIAHTFDGGATWTVSDATPNAPVQRGCIWTGGGANICRNLLDFFDVSIDKHGRVEVGYVNGCSGGSCAQAGPGATGNGYGAVATIARQSSGRRMLAGFDPSTPTSAPGAPAVTQRRLGSVVHLAWSEADNGNSAITSYQILRGTISNSETSLATVTGTQANYDDTTATDPSKTYYYKVVAVNAVGSSCSNNEIAAPYVGDTCTGVIIHQNLPTHPESTAASSNPQLAIDYVSMAEPPSTSNFVFKMKVTNLSTIPPNSRWRIVWDSYASAGQQFYAGMNSDSTSTVSFEYGEIATAVVGLVVGVPTETKKGVPLPTSNFNADGTITIVIAKASVGNSAPGDLLGAVNGRTFTGDTPSTVTLERSTALIDHTFVKAQTDNGYPPATYTVTNNSPCTAPTPTPTPPTTPAQLQNISTRARVLTNDSVLIGGFIITGTDPKKVIVRALGPSISLNGTPLAGRLADPVLELHDGNTVVTNDNWKSDQQTEITNTGFAPTNDLESAIVRTLSPGNYTVIVRGKGGGTGIGLVEVYDLSQTSISLLGNISSRGFVDTNDNVMIGGFIIGPVDRGNPRVVVRALGPSLSSSGVPNTLQNPTLELHDGSGTLISSNDDWPTDPNSSLVVANGLAPSDTRESAIFTPLTPGQYTAIVRGVGNTTGIGLIEVYNLQ
ncbi:MAG TPA: hypothetical protein VE031_02875 [Chthoniobacterales bacterium]|nr:hypothetical protein [Chthoniobacterales bacterium]